MEEQTIIRFLNKECTAEEIVEVEKWISESHENAQWLFEIEQIWSLKTEMQFSKKGEITEAYMRFISNHPEAKPRRQTKRNLWLRIGYAAAVVIILVLGIHIYQLKEDAETIAQSINVIEVPKGQRSTITLSDGTKVWLNAESRLTYPANFAARNRLVKLEGEGFFEVEHNEHHPFIVRTDDIDVTVLGTKFNVEAYAAEITYVTLAEGKVEVCTSDGLNKVILDPRDQVSYSKTEGFTIMHNVNTDLLKAWSTGEFSYINKPLSYIVKDLERRFDTLIRITDKELETEPFNCRAKETAKIEQVLNLLKETRIIDYRKMDDHYEIFKYKK